MINPVATSQLASSGAGALARDPTPRSGLVLKEPDQGVRRGRGRPPHNRQGAVHR